MKKFAFLDVDCTLLYDNNSINMSLIKSLVESGITDVYLFTNIGLNDIRTYRPDSPIASRHKIIKTLKSHGITVHGAITPADTGNYAKNGTLKPIGTAYKELYLPLMNRLHKNGQLDLQNLNSNPDDIADYYINNFYWITASHISRMKMETPFGEKVALPLLRIALKSRKDAKTVRLILNREDLMLFLNDAQAKKEYFIAYDDDKAVRIPVIGDVANDNKAMMMSLALEQLTAIHGPIAVCFFDDTKKHLDGCEQAVARWNSVQGNPQVILNNHLMQKNYKKALLESKNYSTSLESLLTQTKQQEETNSRLIKSHNKWFRRPKTKSTMIQHIRNNMESHTSKDWIDLADLARSGASPLFGPSASLITAFKCLTLACYKANSPVEYKNALANYVNFINTNDYSKFINDNITKDTQVADYLIQVESSARHLVGAHFSAKQLCERKIELLTHILESKHCDLVNKDYAHVSSDIEYYQSILNSTSTLSDKHSYINTKKIAKYDNGVPQLKSIIKNACQTDGKVARQMTRDAQASGTEKLTNNILSSIDSSSTSEEMITKTKAIQPQGDIPTIKQLIKSNYFSNGLFAEQMMLDIQESKSLPLVKNIFTSIPS